MIVIIAAILLTLIFFVSGIQKAQNIDGTAQMIANKLTFINSEAIYKALAILLVAVEIVAPLVILYTLFTGEMLGLAQIAVVSLIAVAVSALAMFYYPVTDDNMLSGMLHLSLIGGLLMLFGLINK